MSLIPSPNTLTLFIFVASIGLRIPSALPFSLSSYWSTSLERVKGLQPPSVRSQLICNVVVDLRDYDETSIPGPRWHCPKDLELCSQTGVTLSRFMMETSRMNPELKDIESIFISLQTAVKAISNLVRTSSLKGNTGLEGGGGAINVQGEEQKKL